MWVQQWRGGRDHVIRKHVIRKHFPLFRGADNLWGGLTFIFLCNKWADMLFIAFCWHSTLNTICLTHGNFLTVQICLTFLLYNWRCSVCEVFVIPIYQKYVWTGATCCRLALSWLKKKHFLLFLCLNIGFCFSPVRPWFSAF